MKLIRIGRYFARAFVFALLVACQSLSAAQKNKGLALERIPHARRLNVIFILTDDQRYDAMGFMGHPFLETPNMDAMARSGVHFKNAFVTTSLCSPSRASILTGMYMHHHGIVDNNRPASEDLVYFPQYLQEAGYQTAFIGKWHFGGYSDAPRPGFDHWVSFKGQGEYFPGKNGLNVDGKHVPQKGYITDDLTDYAIDWLSHRDADKPFFLYFSHKAVHDNFSPAPRDRGRYDHARFPVPDTMANTPENYAEKPMWVYNQRNSWHGVDFLYHGLQPGNIEWLYKRYCEAIYGVDQSLGRVMRWLRDHGLEQNTLVLYMGDNGFLWGEHGLIDKRNAYEESMRVPLLAQCPAILKKGTVVNGIVANIDIAPTILEACGLRPPADMDGRSFLKLAEGTMPANQWRDSLLYEYYWEWNFPQTPTNFALRTDRYKLILYHGIWDMDELYDLQNDPHEKHNLIHDPSYKDIRERLRKKLYAELKKSGGMQIPLNIKGGEGNNLRKRSGTGEAKFPEYIMRDKDAHH